MPNPVAAQTHTQPPSWVAPYINMPFRNGGRTFEDGGVDCWGLFRLVQKEQFDRTLPSYKEVTRDSRLTDDRVAAEIIRHTHEVGPWQPIELEDTKAGDALIIRMNGRPIHVACVIAPGIMLHVMEGINTTWARFDDPRWRLRVIGAYRYAA